MVLLEPFELPLPPFGSGDPVVGTELLEVRTDGDDDRVDDLVVRLRAVGATEEVDPARLFGRPLPVGAQVQPEEKRHPQILEALSRCSRVEVDDPDRCACAEDEIARREVVVAHDLVIGGEGRARGGVVETANGVEQQP